MSGIMSHFVSQGGYPCGNASWVMGPSSPLNRMTDTCENITFPQLRLGALKMSFTYMDFDQIIPLNQSHYRPQGKVMFSEASVCERGLSQGGLPTWEGGLPKRGLNGGLSTAH